MSRDREAPNAWQSVKPQIDVDYSGNDRDYGVAIGSFLAQQILAAEKSLSNYEAFQRLRPWWMPFAVYEYFARRRARLMLEPRVTQFFPHMAERIAGIAQGAQSSVEFLYLFQAMESASTSVPTVGEAARSGCTAIAFSGSSICRPVLAHNFDLVELASPLLALRVFANSRGFRSLAFSLAPMAGIVDGINEAGLAITYNYAPSTDVRCTHPPISFAVEEALSSCATVEHAVRKISRMPRGGGALLMLADAGGDVASLELSARHWSLRRPGSSQQPLHHSNAYQTSEMRRYEPCRSTTYPSNAPEALRDQPIFQSAERRDARVKELLANTYQDVTDERIDIIMADHGRIDSPDSDTICMHGGYWSTLASVRLFPAERRLRVAYGPACDAVFVDFAL